MEDKWKIEHEDTGNILETISKKDVIEFLNNHNNSEQYLVSHYSYDNTVEDRWELLETINGEMFT